MQAVVKASKQRKRATEERCTFRVQDTARPLLRREIAAGEKSRQSRLGASLPLMGECQSSGRASVTRVSPCRTKTQHSRLLLRYQGRTSSPNTQRLKARDGGWTHVQNAGHTKVSIEKRNRGRAEVAADQKPRQTRLGANLPRAAG